MNVEVYGALLAGVLVALPFLLQRYVERLPVAPACPSCRSVTRETASRMPALHLLPSLAVTFVGECGRCGWRGRMRWRWAPRRARDHRR